MIIQPVHLHLHVKVTKFLASLREFKNICNKKPNVDIMITNNGMAFHHEIFHIYSIRSVKFSYWVEFHYSLNNGKVTEVLAGPANDFVQKRLYKKPTIM